MTRRSVAHDYTRPGLYHITMHVAETLGQPFGAVVGSLDAPDGSADAPRTALTRVGQMVEHELLTAIHAHYPMVTVEEYVIMPEHLHVIIKVSKPIVTKNGNPAHLGQVIAGFKQGCNRRFWEIMQWPEPTAHTVPSGSAAGVSAAHTVPSGSPAGKKVPSNGSSGRPPLFALGYCDVMPMDEAQLATQRAYIKGNPRSRLLRSTGGARTHVQRGGIDTALTVTALQGYLQRECPHQATAEALAAIAGRLLLAGTAPSAPAAAHTAPSGSPAGSEPAVHSVPSGSPAGIGRFITCDSYGDRALLQRRLLPVVCHCKDAKRYGEQKQRCLDEAAQGAVLVSACISPKEREIINESVNRGFATITIHDNGFSDRYHPSEERLGLCAEGRLLLVTPWVYQYRGKEEQVTVPFCKAMNCVVQALCSTKDSWWKVCS